MAAAIDQGGTVIRVIPTETGVTTAVTESADASADVSQSCRDVTENATLATAEVVRWLRAEHSWLFVASLLRRQHGHPV